MSRLSFLVLMSPLLLVGCGTEPMRTLGCLQSDGELVIVSRNDPTALDGYDYRICTARVTDPKCGKYNRATAERPLLLMVSLAGGKARIAQSGGSIFDYSSDPAGMRDSDFENAVPLELAFRSHSSTTSRVLGLNTPSAEPSYQIEGKLAKLGPCPKM